LRAAKKLSECGTTEPRYFNELRVLLDGFGEGAEDNAHLRQLSLEGRRHGDAVEHCVHGNASEQFLFS